MMRVYDGRGGEGCRMMTHCAVLKRPDSVGTAMPQIQTTFMCVDTASKRCTERRPARIFKLHLHRLYASYILQIKMI